MSSDRSSITCRRCDEEFPIEDENCPHCGKSVRSTGALFAVGALGVVLAAASVFKPAELGVFGVLGVALVGASGYLLYDKRERIREASEVDVSETLTTESESTE